MGEYLLKNQETEGIPKEVFYQCMWIVKDMDRLKQLAGMSQGKYVLSEDDSYSDRMNLELKYEPVGREAEFKLECIYKSLETIPREYRKVLIEGINNKDVELLAHENTLKRYKLVFIKEMASRLRLI